MFIAQNKTLLLSAAIVSHIVLLFIYLYFYYFISAFYERQEANKQIAHKPKAPVFDEQPANETQPSSSRIA